MTTEYVNALVEERQKAWHAAKEILDRCVAEKRERSAEENESFDRANADIERLGKQIDELVTSERQGREADVARAAIESIVRPADDQAKGLRQASALERFFRGEGTSFDVDLSAAAQMHQAIRAGADPVEARSILTDGGSSAGSLVVPTTFVSQLYQYMEASSAIRRLSSVINTASGEPMTFPKVATHGVGTQVIAQGTAIGGTDPVLGTMSLGAYKYGQLVQLSSEAISDVGFAILPFVAQNMGRALGRITDTAYVTGNGTTAPNGIINAAGTGVKTGGSLISLDLEDLIDLQHSVVDEYRSNAWFVMLDATAATLRKVRESGGTDGQYLWQPVIVAGQPDRLLGSPVATDVNFAAQGSAARAVAFGDFSAYYIRDAGSVRFERSDDYAFNTDLVTFRAVLRTDADLIDTNAIKTTSQLP